MTHAIKHTPIKAESGNMYRWRFNGIASGFQQTQLLDSFVNAIMLLTSLSACGINIESDDFQALFQGDDSISTFPERVDFKIFVPRLSREAKLRFNADLSPEKTTYGNWFDDIEVLSYRYNGGFSSREPAELLAHLLYPERPRTASETAASCIGIASAAMGNRQVYDTCLDLYSFLVDTMKIEPKFKDDLDFNKAFTFWTPQMRFFPTYLDTFLQNFEIGFRSNAMSNRLWPTTPTGNGFHFLVR